MIEGVKILDLSRVLAGPYCTQLLSDLGASVWKLESPGGDETRHWGPPFLEGESTYYLSVNRNKQSVVINLKSEEGPGLIRRLAEKADVVVENFKTGDLARYGLSYADLREVNPRLIYVSITGFGQTGPRASQPGYDAAIQGLSGLMAMTGEPDGPPTKLGVAWVDVLAGTHAAAAVLAALFERERTRTGRQVDLALFDVALAAMVNQGQAALSTGQAPARLGTGHPSIVPYQAMPAADGWLTVAVGNDRQFKGFATALGLAHLADDERYATNAARVQNRGELIPLLEEVLVSRSRAHWLELFTAAGVPAAPVNTLPEALQDPQVAARGMVAPVTHETIGEFSVIQSPFAATLGHQPARSAPPRLGEHTLKVLGDELGLSADELQSLMVAGVIAAGPAASE